MYHITPEGEAFLESNKDAIEDIFDRVRDTVRDFAGGPMGDLHQAFARIASVTYKRAWRWGAGHPAVPRITEILKARRTRSRRSGPRSNSQDPGRDGDADARAVPELDDVRAVHHVHGTDDAHDVRGQAGALGPVRGPRGAGAARKSAGSKALSRSGTRCSRICNSECPSWSHGWTFQNDCSRSAENRQSSPFGER